MITVFWLTLARVVGLFIGAPFFSQAELPARYRVLLTSLLALALIPVSTPETLPQGAAAFVGVMVGEVAIGMSIGLLARFMISSFQMAGTIMGFQMGLAMANTIDPTTQDNTSVVGSVYANMAGMVFLLADGHHLLIRSVASSYEVFPMGAVLRSDVMAETLFDAGARIWSDGARTAAPVTGVMLLINVVLGFLNRVNQQLSIFNIGFPLTVSVGIAALLLHIPGSVAATMRGMSSLTEVLGRVFGL